MLIMSKNRSVLTALGSILGLIILIFIVREAVGFYQQGADEFKEMQRQAGGPILLSETLNSDEEAEAGATEALTATVGLTETATTVTETTAITATAPITTSAAMTATKSITASAAVTTSEAVTATEASTDEVAATAAVTTSEELTSSTPVTTGEVVTTDEASTEPVAVAEPEAVAEAEATEEETAAPEATEEEAAPSEAPAAEEVALTVPIPEEVAPIFVKAACTGCHVIPDVPGAVGAVGPDLSEIGLVGATRVEGLSAVEYIRQSILDPNAFIAPECPTGPCLPGLMIQNLGDVLTPEEIDHVVAYLSSMGVEQ